MKRVIVLNTFLALLLLLNVACGAGKNVPNINSNNDPQTLLYVSINPTPTNISAGNSAQLSIPVGESLQFTATGAYYNAISKNITTTVIWHSSNPDVAIINDTGTALGVKPGSTQITASVDSISSATYTLTVVGSVVTALTVSPTNAAIQISQAQQYLATATYSDGSTKNVTDAVIWHSSNSNVANFNSSSSGIATAVAVGSTQISAALSVMGSPDNPELQYILSSLNPATLTVALATLMSINVTPSNPTVSLGKTEQFTAIGSYSNGTTVDISNLVTWNSSNLGVASFHSLTSGLASTALAGSSQISATLGNIGGSTILAVGP